MDSLEKQFFKSATAMEKALKTHESAFDIEHKISKLEERILKLKAQKWQKIQKYHKQLDKAQELESAVFKRIKNVALTDCVEHTSEEIRNETRKVIRKLEKVTGIIHR